MRYFNWGLRGIVAHQLWPVLKHWAGHPDFRVFSRKIEGDGSMPGEKESLLASISQSIAKRAYAAYLMLLKQYVAANDPRWLLERIDEPLVGNPLIVTDGGKAVSQDLCNSVHEFYSATRAMDADAKGLSVYELGAGYGRVGFVFLTALPSSTYTVIDIPPALFLAQSYLSTVFPDAKVFAFRPFRAYSEIKEEFESARIRFIGAHQITLLPDRAADLFINISSLHEMTMEQIAFYLGQIDRLTRGYFYMKQWRRSRSLENGFRINENDYPIPARFSAVYRERHPLQRMFFHALYSAAPA
jgi:putative sugar O-methyltransferase